MNRLRKVGIYRFDTQYLAHPAEFEKEGAALQELLEKYGLKIINPFVEERKIFNVPEGWKPADWWRTAHPPSEAGHIVERDLELIGKADALFAFVPEPKGFGTMMEIFYAAKVLEKPVFIYTTNQYRWHPWLTYYGQVFTNLDFMIVCLQRRMGFEGKKFRIALGGKMGTGKSTISDFLVKVFQFKQYSFAAKLKEIARDLFGMSKKNREFLQYLGTDVLRKIKEDVWVDYVMRQIETEKPDRAVIDDVRFINEVEACKQHGFRTVKLEAETAHRNVVGLDKGKHKSEIEAEKLQCDFTINTDCSIEAMYLKTMEMMKKCQM